MAARAGKLHSLSDRATLSISLILDRKIDRLYVIVVITKDDSIVRLGLMVLRGTGIAARTTRRDEGQHVGADSVRFNPWIIGGRSWQTQRYVHSVLGI